VNSHFVTLLLVAGVALSAPLLFAAIGELISETAGVINIQLEGMMLVGAFCGVLAGTTTGSVIAGFVGGALGGVALAALHGLLCFVFRANQVVSGVLLNVLALGLTTFGLVTVLDDNAGRSVATLDRVEIPLLSSIPVLGPALFKQNAMVYVAFLIVPLTWYVLRRTAIGLALRAAGERPDAAESLGVRVNLTRWLALLACGALAGIGGAQLVLAGLGAFTQNVTAGRGFIALAAVVFGRWRPGGTLAAVLLFAVADAFQVRAQALDIDVPYQFLVMLPYVITIVGLVVMIGRARAPQALAVNYVRD
jgi:general nucleoside transport system permease protein